MIPAFSGATARRTLALAALLVGTAACGKSDTAEDDRATTTAGGAGAASNLSVTDVRLGKTVGADKRVTDETDDFKASDVIYASVVTSGSAASATLTARWTFEDGQLVGEAQQTLAASDSATEFHVARPDGWPAGRYKVEIALNGRPAGWREFEVR